MRLQEFAKTCILKYMQEEKENFFYRSKISEIPFNQKSFFVKTFIDENDRIKILDFIEKQQENKLDVINDNLIETERTDWDYHLNLEFRPYYNIIFKELLLGMTYFSKNYGNHKTSDNYNSCKFSIFMLNCWYAKSKKNAYVQPHDHGSGYFSFSFSCYLNIPSKISSLTFMSAQAEWRENVAVKEGDILIFPSHLLHWTRDVEENRSILSGNFLLEMKRECDCESCTNIRKLNS